MQKLSTVFLGLGGVLLLFYPFVVLADVMFLAGESPPENNPHVFLDKLVGLSFLCATLGYPAVYIPCLIFSLIGIRRKHERAALVWSVVPFLFLMLLIGFVAVSVWLANSS